MGRIFNIEELLADTLGDEGIAKMTADALREKYSAFIDWEQVESEQIDWSEDEYGDEYDTVNHPSHYTHLPIEVIEITEHFNFCMGNALKYIMRADHKGKPIEDLRKAVWYLNREIERRLDADVQL